MQFPSPLVKLVDITSLLNRINTLYTENNTDENDNIINGILLDLVNSIRMFAEIDLANSQIEKIINDSQQRDLQERAEAQKRINTIKEETDETIKTLSKSFDTLKEQFPVLVNPAKVELIIKKPMTNLDVPARNKLKKILNYSTYVPKELMFTEIRSGRDFTSTVLEPINQVEQLIGNALLMPYQLQNQLMQGKLQNQMMTHNQQLPNMRQ